MLPQPDTCATEEEWNCSKKAYTEIYRNHVNPTYTGCQRSCRYTRFTADKRLDVTKNLGNKTFIFVYYHTTRVMVYEDYLLFDFGSIVSAVGGSLGLFLGFSCWQMVKGLSALKQQSFPKMFEIVNR